jgi:DNA polymerase-3 subunit delta
LRTSLASLSGQLKQGIQPLYILFGAETLLVEEALDQIRSRAKDDGFQERLRFTVETGFDWNQLLEHSQAMSLFAEKRLIELRIATGKPGDAGAKALIQYVQNPLSSDTSLIIICGAIEKRAQGTKWFKAVEAAGTAIECPAIGVDRLPDWISQRLTACGLKYEMEAVEQLSHFVEGNLLAAAQEINLLGLLYPGETITAEIVEHVIADHARFNVYNLADACLAGKVHRVTRILQSLKQEQIQPVLILWALARDTRTLCNLSAAVEKGENPNALFKRFHIWSNRSGNMNSALRRLSRPQWENILRRLGRADLMVKGQAPMQRKDIWEEIESITLGMCGLKIL